VNDISSKPFVITAQEKQLIDDYPAKEAMMSELEAYPAAYYTTPYQWMR